jgi:hypothetical protein
MQVSSGASITEEGGALSTAIQGIALAYVLLTKEKLDTENVPFSHE